MISLIYPGILVRLFKGLDGRYNFKTFLTRNLRALNMKKKIQYYLKLNVYLTFIIHFYFHKITKNIPNMNNHTSYIFYKCSDYLGDGHSVDGVRVRLGSFPMVTHVLVCYSNVVVRLIKLVKVSNVELTQNITLLNVIYEV